MPFILVRIDDRMIHGQVVVGWASALHPQLIVLCHDAIAQNSWEKELYESSYPDTDFKICVFSASELLSYYHSKAFQKERCILLFETPTFALNLLCCGVHFEKLNIGGLHFRAETRALNNYIYLNQEDINSLLQLQKLNVQIEGQDVPNAKKFDVMAAIQKLLKK